MINNYNCLLKHQEMRGKNEENATFGSKTSKKYNVLKIKWLLMAALFLVSFSFAQTVTIGTGTGTATSVPINSCNNFNYSQQIYTAAQMTQAGTIDKIRFYYNTAGTNFANWNGWTVYVGQTAKTSFTSNTDWIPVAGLTQVFSGVITPVAANWFDITFSTPFIYDGTSNFVVAVDENTAGYSCTAAFRSFTSAANTGIYYTNDNTNPNPASPPTGTRVGALAQMQVVFASTTPPNCATSHLPADLATNIAKNPTLSWADGGGGPTSYDVYFGTSTNPSLIGNQTGTTYAPAVLASNTTYFWKVIPKNANGSATGCVERSFTTGTGFSYCNPSSTGSGTYINNFSTTLGLTNISNASGYTAGGYQNNFGSTAVTSYASGSFNYNFTVIGGTLGASIWIDWNNNGSFETGEQVFVTSTFGSGPYSGTIAVPGGTADGDYRMRVMVDYNSGSPSNPCMTANSRTETEDYKITVSAPPSCVAPTALAASAINYQIATLGWTAPTSGTTPIGYEYEVRTSGAAGSGATGLVTSGSTPTNTVDITGLIGGTTYTYYVKTNCDLGDYSAWASGTFSTLNCALPTAVTISAITTTTATVSWTAPATGSPTGYEYEIRTSGAAGSGTTGLTQTGTTTSPTVSADLVGLISSTTYSVYVRSNCYIGLNSNWTSVKTFATICATFTTFPYTESFEGISSGVPACWGLAGNSSASYNFSSTTTGQTGKGLKFDSYLNSNGNTGELITPTLDLTSLATAELKFYFKNPTGGNFEVLISSDGGTTYTSLENALTAQTAWLQKTYDITSYISNNVKVKFKGTSNYGSGDAYIYLDEIEVQAPPTTPPNCATGLIPADLATGIVRNSTLSWTAATGSPLSYDVYFGTSTSPALVGNQIGLTYTPPTMLPNTTYFWKVVPKNGNGDAVGCSEQSFTTSANFAYCTVSTTNSGDYTSAFSTTLANNNIAYTASGQPAGSYTDQTAQNFEVEQGEAFSFSHTYVGGGNGVKIWIDYNNDGNFDASEAVYFLWDSNLTKTGSITVPPSTITGTYRMRVRSQYGFSSVEPPACGNVSYGSTMDFNLNVVAGAITWDGSAWSNTTGPTAADNAIINGDYNITDPIIANTLTVNANKTLIVNSYSSAEAVDVINNGDIIVAHNANFVQTGTFTAGPGSTFKVSRATKQVQRLDYIGWSSPLKNSTQTLKDFSYGIVNPSSTGTLDNRFYTYDNGNFVSTPATGTFATPGQGYHIRTPDDFTTTAPGTTFHGLFTGVEPNTGTVNYDASGITGQYVFLGNPYPSAISMASFLTSNTQTTGTFYIWNSAAKMVGNAYTGTENYITHTAAGSNPPGSAFYVPVGQGFFVDRGTTTSIPDYNNFVFNDGMRSNTETGTFAKSPVLDRFWLKMASSAGSPHMLFAFTADATTGLDNGYDGKMFDNNPDTFYTKINGEKMAIDAHGSFQASDSFDLYINSTVAKSYTISIAQKDGLFNNGGQAIYLKDKTNGTITDLTTGNYTFTSAGTGEENRFEVYFTNSVLATSNAVKEELNIYGNQGVLYVASPSEIANVKVYDLSGRLILNKKVQGKTMQAAINDTKFVLVSVQLKDGSTVSKKVKL